MGRRHTSTYLAISVLIISLCGTWHGPGYITILTLVLQAGVLAAMRYAAKIEDTVE